MDFPACEPDKWLTTHLSIQKFRSSKLKANSRKLKNKKWRKKKKKPAGRVNLRCGTIEEVKLGSKLEVGSGMRELPPWILHSECGRFSLSMAVLSFPQRKTFYGKFKYTSI